MGIFVYVTIALLYGHVPLFILLSAALLYGTYVAYKDEEKRKAKNEGGY